MLNNRQFILITSHFTVKRVVTNDNNVLDEIPAGEITIEELLSAAKQLKKDNGKASGPDGIPLEVLQDM